MYMLWVDNCGIVSCSSIVSILAWLSVVALTMIEDNQVPKANASFTSSSMSFLILSGSITAKSLVLRMLFYSNQGFH